MVSTGKVAVSPAKKTGTIWPLVLTGAVLVKRELDYKPWCVAYSPDGRALAIGTNTGHVLLFETERHTQQLAWRAHEGVASSYVYSIVWTPDGTRLVTASGDASPGERANGTSVPS